MKTFKQFVEHHQTDANGKVIEHGDGTPSSVEEAKVEAGRSDYGKASVRNKRKFGKEGEPAVFDASGERGKMIDQRRAEHKAKRGVKEDYYSGTGEKVVARTKKWMDKKGQKGAPGLDAMKARSAEHKAKRGVKEEVLDELKSTTLLSYSNKAANELAFKGDGGKKAQKRATGVKRAAGQLTMKAINKEEVVIELNRYGKETGKATGSINKREGTPVKKGGSSDKVLNYVRTKIRKETGKPEGQQKKVKGEKGRVQYGDRKVSPSTTIAKRRQAAKDADAAMRDTRGT